MKKGQIAVVVGGNGFIGSYVVRELVQRGLQVRVVGRHAGKAGYLRIFGYVGQVALLNGDALDEKFLSDALDGAHYVVNLPGLFVSRGRQSFKNVHVKIAGLVAKISQEKKVRKLVHFSALGIDVSAKKSKYAKTKLEGEQAINKYYPGACIIRPSVVFGPEDNFSNLFNRLAKLSPFLPLIGGGEAKFQPVYVGDVASFVVQILEQVDNVGISHTYEIGGAEIIALKDVIGTILSVTNRNRILVPLPFSLAKIKAAILQLAPHPILTMDQVELLKYDNVTKANALDDFAIKPKLFKAMIESYLK